MINTIWLKISIIDLVALAIQKKKKKKGDLVALDFDTKIDSN